MYLPEEASDDFKSTELAKLRKSKKRSCSEASVSLVTEIALEQTVFAMWEDEKATSS